MRATLANWHGQRGEASRPSLEQVVDESNCAGSESVGDMGNHGRNGLIQGEAKGSTHRLVNSTHREGSLGSRHGREETSPFPQRSGTPLTARSTQFQPHSRPAQQSVKQELKHQVHRQALLHSQQQDASLVKKRKLKQPSVSVEIPLAPTNPDVKKRKVSNAKASRAQEEHQSTRMPQKADSSPSKIVPAPAKKMPRPVDASVEPCQLGDALINLPAEIVFLKDPSEIFSVDTWYNEFTDEDREYLATLLPQSADIDDPLEILEDLFENDDFFFGSPVLEFWQRLRRGRYHPQLKPLVDSFYQLVKRKHYQEVREYQEEMVDKLESMKSVWEPLGDKTSLPRRLKCWRKAVAASGVKALIASVAAPVLPGRKQEPSPSSISHSQRSKAEKLGKLHPSLEHGRSIVGSLAAPPDRMHDGYGDGTSMLAHRSASKALSGPLDRKASSDRVEPDETHRSSQNLGFSLPSFLEVVAEAVYLMCKAGVGEGAISGVDGQIWWPTTKVFQEVFRRHGKTDAFRSKRFRPQELVSTALRVLCSRAPPGTKLWKPFIASRKQGTQWTWCGTSPSLEGESQKWAWLVSEKALAKLESRFREYLVASETEEVDDVTADTPALAQPVKSMAQLMSRPAKEELESEKAMENQQRRSLAGKRSSLEGKAKSGDSLDASRRYRGEDYFLVDSGNDHRRAPKELTAGVAFGSERQEEREAGTSRRQPALQKKAVNDVSQTKQLPRATNDDEDMPEDINMDGDSSDNAVGASDDDGENAPGPWPEYEGLPTISDSLLHLFQKEERVRYQNPTKTFRFTAADGGKSMVSPVVRPGGRAVGKVRDHSMLQPDRPPGVTILSLVRDAAARLPHAQGSRTDVGTLLKCSQYLAFVPDEPQLNQIVSGAMDRLHYEKDPCIRFDSDRKLWLYLHRKRRPDQFLPDGMVSRRPQAPSKRKDVEQGEDGQEGKGPEDVHGSNSRWPGHKQAHAAEDRDDEDVEDENADDEVPATQAIAHEEASGGWASRRRGANRLPKQEDLSRSKRATNSGLLSGRGESKALGSSRGFDLSQSLNVSDEEEYAEEGNVLAGTRKRDAERRAPSPKLNAPQPLSSLGRLEKAGVGKAERHRGGQQKKPKPGDAKAVEHKEEEEEEEEADKVKALQGQLSLLQGQLLQVQGQLAQVQGQFGEVVKGRSSTGRDDRSSSPGESSQLLRHASGGHASSHGSEGRGGVGAAHVEPMDIFGGRKSPLALSGPRDRSPLRFNGHAEQGLSQAAVSGPHQALAAPAQRPSPPPRMHQLPTPSPLLAPRDTPWDAHHKPGLPPQGLPLPAEQGPPVDVHNTPAWHRGPGPLNALQHQEGFQSPQYIEQEQREHVRSGALQLNEPPAPDAGTPNVHHHLLGRQSAPQAQSWPPPEARPQVYNGDAQHGLQNEREFFGQVPQQHPYSQGYRGAADWPQHQPSGTRSEFPLQENRSRRSPQPPFQQERPVSQEVPAFRADEPGMGARRLSSELDLRVGAQVHGDGRGLPSASPWPQGSHQHPQQQLWHNQQEPRTRDLLDASPTTGSVGLSRQNLQHSPGDLNRHPSEGAMDLAARPSTARIPAALGASMFIEAHASGAADVWDGQARDARSLRGPGVGGWLPEAAGLKRDGVQMEHVQPDAFGANHRHVAREHAFRLEHGATSEAQEKLPINWLLTRSNQ